MALYSSILSTSMLKDNICLEETFYLNPYRELVYCFSEEHAYFEGKLKT